MARLAVKYHISETDVFVVTKAQIKIETYLISMFVAEVNEVDHEFVMPLRIEDFRVKERDDPDQQDEWTVWLVDQDPSKCQELVEKLREFDPANTDWTCEED